MISPSVDVRNVLAIGLDLPAPLPLPDFADNRGVLAGLPVILPEGGLFTAKGLAGVRGSDLPDDARGTVDRFLRLHEVVDAKLESLVAQLRTLAHHDDRARPTVEPGCRGHYPDRFCDGDHAASYPCPDTKADISTAGAILTQAAQQAVEQPGPLCVLFRRLGKGKALNVAIVVTTSKLATRSQAESGEGGFVTATG